MGGFVYKEDVVLYRWGSETKMSVKQVDEGEITTEGLKLDS